MSHPRPPAVAALLAVTCLIAPACGKSSTPSPVSKAPTPAAVTSSALPAADCAVIKPIAGEAIGTLTPLQTQPKAAAAASMTRYITRLKAAEGRLTSATGKADLSAFVLALQQAGSAGAAAQITSAIGKLTTDCP
jgi:hypothetical protein